VTIDVAGCRVAIDERVNGVVVPPRDVSALARTIESFLLRPDQLDWMSRASRRKAERCFDANAISRELLALMGLTEQK
jgi:glycosyltransferase involved in cell wall biosynthesis